MFENVQKSKCLLLEIFTFSSFKVSASLTIFRVLFGRFISDGMFDVIRVLRDCQFQFSLSAAEGGSIPTDSVSCAKIRLIEQSWP